MSKLGGRRREIGRGRHTHTAHHTPVPLLAPASRRPKFKAGSSAVFNVEDRKQNVNDRTETLSHSGRRRSQGGSGKHKDTEVGDARVPWKGTRGLRGIKEPSA